MTSKQTEMLRVDNVSLMNSQVMSNASSMVIRRIEDSDMSHSQMDSSVMDSGHRDLDSGTKFERGGDAENGADRVLQPFNDGARIEGQTRT